MTSQHSYSSTQSTLLALSAKKKTPSTFCDLAPALRQSGDGIRQNTNAAAPGFILFWVFDSALHSDFNERLPSLAARQGPVSIFVPA